MNHLQDITGLLLQQAVFRREELKRKHKLLELKLDTAKTICSATLGKKTTKLVFAEVFGREAEAQLELRTALMTCQTMRK